MVVYNVSMFIDEIHVKSGQKLTVCKGGRGNQARGTAEKGEPAEERGLRLERKLIADIVLIGVPNAGKSNQWRVSGAAIERASMTDWQD